MVFVIICSVMLLLGCACVIGTILDKDRLRAIDYIVILCVLIAYSVVVCLITVHVGDTYYH